MIHASYVLGHIRCTKSASAVPDMVFDFSTRRDILVDARRETDYHRAYADSFRPVEIMATLMTGMLIIGGIVTGMNTFLAAVLGRVREIGMLRARHEISVSNISCIWTNCIVPFSVERVGTNIYFFNLLF